MAIFPSARVIRSATGFFTPAPVASRFCIAPHFQDASAEVPVIIRFSNGSGCAVVHDGWSDVRGMATRFDLGPEGATDLIAMNLSEFFTPMPETF